MPVTPSINALYCPDSQLRKGSFRGIISLALDTRKF
jgi:hypothetical protein